MTLSPQLDEPDNDAVSRLLLTRRGLLRLAGASVAGLGLAACGDSSTTTATATPAATPLVPAASPAATACMALTAEQIEGPYYLDRELVRQDITEGRPGVPLTLELKAVDSVTCAPLTGAAIEVWHCDSQGIYSGYAPTTFDFREAFAGAQNGGTPPPGAMPPAAAMPPPGGGGGHQEPVNDLTFLRGIQMTDAEGAVRFTSVVPGWYAGRALHIHVKVHVDGVASATGYTGGRQAHTGQLYFDEAPVRELATLPDYVGNPVKRVLLDEDVIYPGGGVTGGLLALDQTQGSVAKGVTGTITMAVERAGTHDGSDAPGLRLGPR